MTANELGGAVRRSAGCGPKDFLLGVRLGRVKELLAGTDLPVAAIARRVGYHDPACFSRLFTRRVGTAPMRCRERQGRNGAWLLERSGARTGPAAERSRAPSRLADSRLRGARGGTPGARTVS